MDECAECSQEDRAGFGRVDWLAFAITATAVLGVYLFTLAPQVTLGFGGIFSTAAMYGGVPHPPGYPLAVWWQWLFVMLLPISNVAWRAAVSSAVAGALASGLMALMVSRLGKEVIQHHGCLTKRDTARVRIACGFAAGTVFGFNGAFWGRAVIADVWTVSVFLFCGALCLMMRWCWTPHHTRWLYGACFVYGLTLTNSQIFLAAAPAIPVLIAVGRREVARDVLAVGCAVFIGGLIEGCPGGLSIGFLREGKLGSLLPLHVMVGMIVVIACVRLVAVTRRVLSEWKAVLGCGAAFVLGLTPYLYVPIVSMANPPMNWGYARTAGGFFHVISRGQYEKIEPTAEAKTFTRQMKMYAAVTRKEFGWPFVIVAALPWLFFSRMLPRERAWMLALLMLYLCLTLLMLAVLNPVDHLEGRRTIKVFFSASYVVLAIWVGVGLITVVELLTASKHCAA